MNLFTMLLIGAKKALNTIWVYATKNIVNEPTKNYVEQGTLIQGPGYINFSQSSFITIPVVKPTTSMDIIVKTHTPEYFNDNSPIQATEGCKGVIFRIDSSRRVHCWISSNGTSWDICNGYYPGLQIPTNTDVCVRVKWDGAKYYFGYSLDGEEYTWGNSVNNTNAVYWNNGYQNLGGCDWEGYAWPGLINVRETKFYVDDNIIFDGNTAQESIDYTVIGSLVHLNNSAFTNFSRNNYLKIPIINTYMNSFEYVIKARTPNSYTRENSVMQYSGSNSSIIYRINTSGNVHIWMSSDGTSWNVRDNWYPGFNIPTDTDIWFIVKWDGTAYTVGYSVDGENYTTALWYNSNKLVWTDGYQYLGGCSSEETSWQGLIYLEECYLKINNNLAWTWYKYPLNVGDKISINEGLGYANYKWNAYPEITNIQYDCYTNNIDDVYLKHENIKTDKDYRYTNHLCTNGPGYSDFSTSNYINIPLSKSYSLGTINSFEMIFKATTPNNWSSNGRLINSSDSYDNIALDVNTTNAGLNLCGSNYKALFGPQSNTIYWFKYDFNGSAITGSYSKNGIDWNIAETKSVDPSTLYLTTPILNVGCRKYDNYSGCIWNGSIDISQYYIKVNDDILFDGSTAVAGIDYTIIGSLKYLPNETSYSSKSGQYVLLNSIPGFAEANSWEFKFKTMYNGGSSYPAICGSSDSSFYHNLHVHFMNGVLKIWLPKNGRWLIEGGATTCPATIGAIYYIKIIFTGTQYKVWWSDVGWDDEGHTDIILNSSEKIDSSSKLALLNIYGNNQNWSVYYYYGYIDLSESSITLDNVEYPLGYTNITSQFYEKTSETSVSPITVNAKLNMDDKIVINDSIYNIDTNKDILVPQDFSKIYIDSTDGNSLVDININEDNVVFNSEAPLTEKRKVIDTKKYFTFDLEYLNDYNTTLMISGKPYTPDELPCYFTSDMKFDILLQRKDNPYEVYEKTFWLSQNWIYKKQILTFNIDQTIDKATIYINGSCKIEYTNVNTFTLEAYADDYIHYIIEKDNYATIDAYYQIDNNVYINPTKTINLEMTRVYKYTFNIIPNTAKLDLVSKNMYTKQDNWIQVYYGAMIEYEISLEGYEPQNGTFTNITADNTLNINLVAIPTQTDLITTAYESNIINNRCVVYKNSNDALIVSGERTDPNNSNYTYFTSPLLPLDKVNSWEIRTAYRYKGGGSYPAIFVSSKDNFIQGGINFYISANRFRLDIANNQTSYYMRDVTLGSVAPESGYEYKFKIGQIIENNEWTANDGGGTKSTIYVDYIKSDRNTTENPRLAENGTINESNYACISSDNSEVAYKVFTDNNNPGINPTLTSNGTMGGSACACTASHQSGPAWYAFNGDTTTSEQCWWTNHGNTSVNNPCWITYYTPDAIKPTKIVFMNEVATPSSGKTGIIQGSNDNSNWDDLANINIPNNNAGYKTEINISTNNTYKYIRCYFTESWEPGGVSFQEIFIYGFPKLFDGIVPTIENPIWVTFFTLTAINPRSFTILNDDTLNNIKNAVIEGSTDNTNWTTLYTIKNRPQLKNLSEIYKVNIEGKYNYFRFKITETYLNYKITQRNYFIETTISSQITLASNFFKQALFGDNDNGIANFEYTIDGWQLNGNDITITDYLSYENPQVNDNIKVYYSTKIEEVPITSTNIKQIIIDGFPFTYSNDYTRLYTNVRDTKEYNIIDGELVQNSNYVANKNVYVSAPLAFLGTSLDNDHYSYGHINLAETKCYIDNELYWEAQKTFNVNDRVNIIRGAGVTNDLLISTGGNTEIDGILSCPAVVKSINNTQVTVTPLNYCPSTVTINSDQNDSNIYTFNELPTNTLRLNVLDENGNDMSDAIIDTYTIANDSYSLLKTADYRNIHIEQLPEQEIEFYINNQKYVVDSNNPVLDVDVKIKDIFNNTLSIYWYRIKENNNVIAETIPTALPDNNITWLVHLFKVKSDQTGTTVTYNIGDKTYVTTDGEVLCYSNQVINWKVEKTGFITQTGSYTVPIGNITNNLYSISLTLNISESK